MKVSEAIDRLEVGETVWVKATVDRINSEGKYIRVMPNASSVYLDGHDEISLSEPQAEKVEVPDFVAEWYEANKSSLESNIAAAFRRIGSDEHYTKGPIYEWLNDSSNEPIQTLFKMKDGYTFKPKRWVVRHEAGKFFEKFTGNGISRAWVVWKSQAYIFTDRAKAEAVATLVEGSVEEV